MKKIPIFLLCFSFLFSFTGCQLLDERELGEPKPRSISEDLEIVKKYMRIDRETNQYAVFIDEETRLNENISKSNLIQIFGDIDALNQEVAQSIENGDVVTLYLSTQDSFDSHTVNLKDDSGIEFKDVRIPYDKKAETRGGFLSSVSFFGGNWTHTAGSSFTGSDHVTSSLYVGYSRGYWQVQFVCNTGTSAYGNSYIVYGSGGTGGTYVRYWWWTGGGGSPFNWNFRLGGPPGGEANGGINFSNTN